MKSVTVRIRGGLGNQLFCYALAFHIATINQLDLIIDGETGFIGDNFGRAYSLDKFGLKKGRIKQRYRLFSSLRIARLLVKIFYILSRIPHNKRLFQVESWGSSPYSAVWVNNNLYLDGYWQNVDYLFGFRESIRNNLLQNFAWDSQRILKSNSVAVHFRSGKIDSVLSDKYYHDAVRKIKSMIKEPHFYLFSDVNLASAEKFFNSDEYTIVSTDQSGEFNDFIFMSQCKNFIIANSTFSWWASFLAENDNKIILAPKDIEKNLVSIHSNNYILV